MELDMKAAMRLLQFTDSTFPVGTFSFSNGLETAQFERIVNDAESLRAFTKSQAVQAAFSDGVAALISHRAFLEGDYDKVLEADAMLMRFKMNDEARLMLSRMGKKLAELAVKLFPSDEIVKHWLQDIRDGSAHGSYPVSQGIAFAAAGIDARALFASSQYGVINMVLSAALRCVKVSHYDTQEILFDLSEDVEKLYHRAALMNIDDMRAFFPQLDIIASLHEKGNMRMFMN
ncbi:MAG: urease accessory protein UreF [Bacteroidales bacterium]|nr:urease accessory protein UreF [Bacteroidales bacterium]MBD5204199.1 urease accessory protein UreF [Bacteroidales bacterium]